MPSRSKLAMGMNLGTQFEQLVTRHVGKVDYCPGNLVDASVLQHSQAGAQGQETGHVLRAPFVPPGRGFQVQFNAAEVEGVDDAIPPYAQRT